MADRWFLSDCEGELAILREAALRNVTRDERGEIDGYRMPANCGPDTVIAEWDLNTWDPGEDETDDLTRANAESIVRAHNERDQLTARVAQLEAALAEAQPVAGGLHGRLADARDEIAKLRAERDRLAAQVQRVRDLHPEEVLADGGRVCGTCRDHHEEPIPWPCDDIRALDGGEA